MNCYTINNEKGQGMVEYILLIAVVVTLCITVLRSQAFKNIAGDESKFATIYKNEIEYTYRNTHHGREAYSEPNYNSPATIPAYSKGFFGAKEAYPKN